MTNGTDIQIGSRIDIPRNNEDLPEATTYEKFRDLLKNTKNDVTTKSIQYTTDFIVRPQKGNSETTRNTNTYAIQTTNNNGQDVLVCYVVGQDQMEDFTSDYATQEISNHKVNVKLQIIEGIESTSIVTSSQNELGRLKDRVTGFAFTETGIKEFFENQKDEVDLVTKQYKHRADEVKDQSKKKLNSSVLEKEMFILLDFSITEGLKNIQRLEINLKNLETEYKKGLLDEPTWKDKTERIATELRNHTLQQSHIGQIINSLVVSSDQVMPDIDIKLPINDSKDAEKVRKVYSKMAVERLLINNISVETDLRKVQNQHGDDLYEYLKNSLDTGATPEPFIPAVGQETAFNNIKDANPQVAKYLDSFMPVTTKNNTKEATDGSKTGNGQEIYTNPIDVTHGRSSGGLLDKLTPGPLTDIIDNANIEPQTKERFKNLAGVAFLIGAGVLAWKTVKGAFKAVKGDADSTDRARLAGGAALFGSAYVSSGNIFDFKSLGKDVGNMFSSNPDSIPGGKVDAAPEAQTANGLNNVNILLAGMKYGEIKNFVKKDTNGKMEIDYDKFTLSIDNGKLDNKAERKQVLENIKTSQHPKLFDMAMTTIGITREKLNDPQQAETAYNKNATEALVKFVTIAKFMTDNAYDHRNPELTTLIQSYIRTGSPELTMLERLGAFEKATPPEANPTLKTKIDTFTSIDKTGKDNLYYYATRVQEELKNKYQYIGTFDIVEKSGKLYIQTYGEETEIEYKNKAISNEKGSKIILASNYEMIKAANLTNRLKSLFKKQSTLDTPFNLSIPGGDLEFKKDAITTGGGRKNPRDKLKSSFDTEVVAGGRKGTLQEISPNLEKYKDTYVTFLNNMKIRKK